MSDDVGANLADGVDALFRGKLVVKWALVVDVIDPADEGRQLAVASSQSCASWDAVGMLQAALDRELFIPDYEFDIEDDEEDEN